MFQLSPPIFLLIITIFLLNNVLLSSGHGSEVNSEFAFNLTDHNGLRFDKRMQTDFDELCQELNLDAREMLTTMRSDVDRFFTHGQFACTLDRPAEAFKSIRSALMLQPKMDAGHLLLGRILLGQGRWAESAQEFKRLLRMKPSQLEGILGLRLCLERMQVLPAVNGKCPSENVTVSETDLHDHALFLLDLALCQAMENEMLQLGLRIESPCELTKFAAVSSHCTDEDIKFATQQDLGLDYQNSLTQKSTHQLLPESLWISQNMRQQFDENRERFAMDKYVMLESLLESPPLKILQAWGSTLVKRNILSHEPTLKRLTRDTDALGILLAHQLHPLMMAIAGRDIVPTYNFWIYYLEGGEIPPHVDRHQNQYSVTLNIACPSEWPLYVYPFSTPHRPQSNMRKQPGGNVIIEDDSEPNAYYMQHGDAIFYEGTKIIHGRRPLARSMGHCLQLVFGYRDIGPTHCNSQ